MNRREATVVALLTAALILGAGIAVVRRGQLIRERRNTPVTVYQAAADTVAAAYTPAEGQPLDLNAATAGLLEALPGIGQVLALRIIDFRTKNGGFKSVTQLRRVSGIGPILYAVLKELVVVGTAGDTSR